MHRPLTEKCRMSRRAIAEDLSMEARAQMPKKPVADEFRRFLTGLKEIRNAPVSGAMAIACG